MISRKKKREIEKDESEEDGLHKNQSLFEYQNKCLCTVINDLRTKLVVQEKSYNILEEKFNALSSFLNKFYVSIDSINEQLDTSIKNNNLTISETQIPENIYTVSTSSDLIQNIIKNNQSEKNNSTKVKKTQSQSSLVNSNNKIIVDDEEEVDEEKNKEKNIPDFEPIKKFTKLMDTFINKLVPLIKLNQKQFEKLFNNLENDIINKNKLLEDSKSIQSKEINRLKLEKEHLKTQSEIYQSKINEIQEQIENLNSENFKLNRKLNTHPLMPYIIIEGNCLDNKPISEHNCICVVCGKNFNNNSNNTDNKSEDKNSNINEKNKNSDNGTNKNSDNNKNKNQDSSNNSKKNSETNTNNKENEIIDELTKENEALRSRIRELHESLDEISRNNEITEENIVSSKSFQSLIGQAENILSKLEKMKEINSELQKKNNSLNQIKENEIYQISKNFNEQIEKCSAKLLESSKTIEKNKQTIQLLMNKIESLENLFKAKEIFDINKMYDTFEKERGNLMKQIEAIKAQKKDYLNKYDDECEKNKTNELTICKLKNELSNLRLLMGSNKMDEKKLQYDHNNEIIKAKREKIEIYKKENERLKYELNKERNNYEGMVEMAEANEKGISSLNTIIKNLKKELAETKEIQAKMSNEKLKDNQTIIFLNEGKDVLEKKNLNLQEQIENYAIFTKKIQEELDKQRELNHLLEEEKKLNEKDIEKLKTQNVEHLKMIEKEKTLREDFQNKYNEAKNLKSKQSTEYDVLKTKYEDLKKFKQFDPSTESVENINKENEMLKMENQKFREMVHCKVCKTKIKNVVITKCFHTFCRGCIEATIESRKRRCPICREQISQNDVKEIFWD